MDIKSFLKEYKESKLYYISVNHRIEKDDIPSIWKNISSYINIKGEYVGMGVDRKALCLSHDNGLFVDAGSAITVDRVTDGVYQGGFILPGIYAYKKAFASISQALNVDIKKDIDINTMPKGTENGVSFGIIAPIVAIIEKFLIQTQIDKMSINKVPIYFTGSDGKMLSERFENAIYDDMLLFRTMKKVIKVKDIKC